MTAKRLKIPGFKSSKHPDEAILKNEQTKTFKRQGSKCIKAFSKTRSNTPKGDFTT